MNWTVRAHDGSEKEFSSRGKITCKRRSPRWWGTAAVTCSRGLKSRRVAANDWTVLPSGSLTRAHCRLCQLAPSRGGLDSPAHSHGGGIRPLVTWQFQSPLGPMCTSACPSADPLARSLFLVVRPLGWTERCPDWPALHSLHQSINQSLHRTFERRFELRVLILLFAAAPVGL